MEEINNSAKARRTMKGNVKKMAITWNEFLATYFHCCCDENGNRPCDNGALCDQCMTKEATEMFELLNEGEEG